MKPIRFFTQQQTIWYNLSDYIQLLLDTGIIRSLRPTPLYKRKIPAKSIHTILSDKVNRMSPVYHRQQDGMTYVDWVVFEHLYRLIKPFLSQPDDWMNPDSLFRQLQLVIERPKRLQQVVNQKVMAAYFEKIESTPSSNERPDNT